MQGSKRAAELRRNFTDAEALLWFRLRNRRLGSHKFRRQVPIGPFIVDFVCMSARLAIELDGGQHAEQKAYDDERSRYLEREGFDVLRFWNNEVLCNLDGVLQVILWEVEERIKRPSP